VCVCVCVCVCGSVRLHARACAFVRACGHMCVFPPHNHCFFFVSACNSSVWGSGCTNVYLHTHMRGQKRRTLQRSGRGIIFKVHKQKGRRIFRSITQDC